MGTRLAGVEVYLAERRVGTEEVERRIAAASAPYAPPPGVIDRLTGIASRHVADPHEQASDLVVAAAALRDRIVREPG